ncbi:hypothetical protein [Arcobacter sp. LA11]|uniref:hypothetical protein n=1 Tax=Arcobacter sp. LA11 TaxID=1898176 RepID=UPI0009330105|nr:hypothetical protein [Arcobacter sp. LA11]
MNKLNPMYILALMITVFIVSFVSVSNKKEEYKNSIQTYENVKMKSKDFKEYKKTWFNKNQIRRKIDNIVRNSTFRKEKILKVENSNIIKLKIESKNPRVLNKFLNKILNEKLILKKLDIQKRSISMEIGI